MNRALTQTLLLLAATAALAGCTISGPDIHIRPPIPIQIEVGGGGYHHGHHHHHDD